MALMPLRSASGCVAGTNATQTGSSANATFEGLSSGALYISLSPEDREGLSGRHVALDHEEGGHDGRRARVAQQAVHKHLRKQTC